MHANISGNNRNYLLTLWIFYYLLDFENRICNPKNLEIQIQVEHMSKAFFPREIFKTIYRFSQAIFN